MIDKEKIDTVARLARIHLQPQEKELMRQELSQVLHWAEALSIFSSGEKNTPASEGDVRAAGSSATWRPDEVTEQHPPQDIVGQGPCVQGDFFVVPRVTGL